MPKRQGTFTPDVMDDIYTRLATLEHKIANINKTPSWIERVNPEQLPEAVEGQVAIDARSNCFIYYANGHWREKCSAVHAIKVFGDRSANKVLNGAFRFTAEDDLDQSLIEHVQAFNGTPGSGDTIVQIRNVTRNLNILSQPLNIPSGELISDDNEVINDLGPINNPFNKITKDDMIYINVTQVGGGSKGLGVYIFFHGMIIDAEWNPPEP
jgi:hypothetical protein